MNSPDGAPVTASARVEETVRAVRARVAVTPKVGLVLGSGLGAFADSLAGLAKIPYAELPHLPASKVVGHAGNLCFGKVGEVPVVCMQGRIHLYEGHPVWQVVHGALDALAGSYDARLLGGVQVPAA